MSPAPAMRAPTSQPPPELDQVTLRRAQRGDEDACRELVEVYQGRVFALLSRVLGPGRRAAVEDLAQETFLSAFRSLARFSTLGPARLSTWLLTIASRRAVDELRRRTPAVASLDDVDPPGPERADEHTRRRRVAVAIQRAVADLAPAYRAAFVLREYHGFEYVEIGRALDVDVGTVKSRLARARRALREALAEVFHEQ